MRALGRILDVTVGINPVADLAAGANTGKRIHLRNYDTLNVLFMKNAASAGTDTITITLQEHDANTGGNSQNLVAITEWYYKSTAAALAGTEQWTEVTQTAAATLAMPDTGPIKAANQAMVMFSVEASALSAGFQWASVNIADPGSGGTILGSVLYIPTGLHTQRLPSLLAQPNA